MAFPNLQPYQLIIAILSVIMIGQGLYTYGRHKAASSLLKLSIRLIVWGGMATIALYPPVTYWLARITGIEGNINAVVLTGFLLIFLFLFKLLSIIERLEQDLSTLVRKDTLQQLKKYEKK